MSWSCGRTDVGWRFLLLRAFNHWDFPKGMVEEGEEPLAAALREVKEESCIADLVFEWGDGSTHTGPYSRGKVAQYFIASTRTTAVELPVNPEIGRPEHAEFRWAGFDEAAALVSPRLQPVLRWAAMILNLPAGAESGRRAQPRRAARDTLTPATATPEVLDVGGQLVEAALARLTRRPRDVRCHDQVRDIAREQRVAVHRRFLLQHVDGGAAEAPAAQRIGQRYRVDQRPARGVDQHRVRLHSCESLRADQALGRGRERAVQAQHVDHRQQLVQVHAARLSLATGRFATITFMPKAPAACATPRPSAP